LGRKTAERRRQVFVRSVDCGQPEDLARVDQVGIPDLVLVGAIDQGVAEAIAVACARNLPETVVRSSQPCAGAAISPTPSTEVVRRKLGQPLSGQRPCVANALCSLPCLRGT
jgi:hypothetical protein